MLGAVRELLGNGSLLGFPLFGPSYEPWIVMILPPGGFLTLGVLLLGLAWWQERRSQRVEAPEPKGAVGPEVIATAGISLPNRSNTMGEAQ
jgi:hypothetical protein